MKKPISFILALVLAASLRLPASAVANVYTDWVSGAWYESALEYCVENGIFGGSNGKIEARRAITRAEYVTALVRYFGYTETADVAFDDVSEGDWFYESVAAAVRAGITNGADGGFHPHVTITREQAITMYIRGLALEPVDVDEVLSTVPDADSISSWAREPMALAYNYGILDGYGDGTLRPKGAITRAETAKILYTATVEIFDGEVPLAELPSLGGYRFPVFYVDPRVAAEQQRLNEAAGTVRVHVDTDLFALVGETDVPCTIENYLENGKDVTFALHKGDTLLWERTLGAGGKIEKLELSEAQEYGNYPVTFTATPEGGAPIKFEATLYVAYLWG